MYMQGDRQQNSHVLADKVTENLLENEIDREMVSKVLNRLLVFYFSFMSCNILDKHIELFEKYESGKADMPVSINFNYHTDKVG